MADGTSGELNSWKEIAKHLDTTVRSAQRWESERGLPVRRLSGSKGRVVATVAEIDKWKQRDALQQIHRWNNPKWLRLYGAAVTIVLLASAGVLAGKYLFRDPLGPPSAFQSHDRQIVVLDHRGQKLWTHTFPKPLGTETYAADIRGYVQFVDLEGDGRVETVAVYKADQMKRTNELYCFSETGDVRWRFSAGRVIRDGADTFYPPYHFVFIRTLVSPEASQERWIVATSNHHLSYPSQLVVIDAQGKLRGEYWHPGHMDSIEIANVDGEPGDEIVVAGENRREGKASVVILNPRQLIQGPTSSEIIPESLHPAEQAIIFFPRTKLNVRLEQINHACRAQWTGHALEVQVEEARVQRPSSDLNYVFDESLALRGIYPWDTIRSSYKEVFGSPEEATQLFKEDLERVRRGVVVRRSGHSRTPLIKPSRQR